MWSIYVFLYTRKEFSRMWHCRWYVLTYTVEQLSAVYARLVHNCDFFFDYGDGGSKFLQQNIDNCTNVYTFLKIWIFFSATLRTSLHTTCFL